MCEALRELMAEEFEENTKEVTRELAVKFKKKGVAISVIAETTGLSKEELMEL